MSVQFGLFRSFCTPFNTDRRRIVIDAEAASAPCTADRACAVSACTASGAQSIANLRHRRHGSGPVTGGVFRWLTRNHSDATSAGGGAGSWTVMMTSNLQVTCFITALISTSWILRLAGKPLCYHRTRSIRLDHSLCCWRYSAGKFEFILKTLLWLNAHCSQNNNKNALLQNCSGELE